MGLEVLPIPEEVDLCVLGRVILSFCLLKYFSVTFLVGKGNSPSTQESCCYSTSIVVKM